MANKNAGAVSEAELRTKDLSHILGEQENLTPGLSGGFALVVQPGHYVINCPGASQQHATFTVTGKAKVVSAQTKSLLTAAASGYSTYVNQQVAGLVSSTQALCAAINTGNLTQAQQALPAGTGLLRAHRARGRGLGHARHRHRRPHRQPGDEPGRPHRFPPDRRDHVGRQHPDRRIAILLPARDQ